MDTLYFPYQLNALVIINNKTAEDKLNESLENYER